MIARVARVIAASTCCGSMLNVTGSISTNTGCAPRAHQLAVAKNVKLGTMTSSPTPIPNAIMASNKASLPEARLMARGTSHRRAISASSARQSGPCRNRPESTTRPMAARISSRSGEFPPTTSKSGTETVLLPVSGCDSFMSIPLPPCLGAAGARSHGPWLPLLHNSGGQHKSPRPVGQERKSRSRGRGCRTRFAVRLGVSDRRGGE